MRAVLLIAICASLLFAIPFGPFGPPIHGQKSAVVSLNPGNILDFSLIPGSIVSYQVNLTDAPSITGFLVYISFNRSVIGVARDSSGNFMIDSSGNVLANTGASLITSDECVDGYTIAGSGNACGASFGEVILGLTILGSTTTSSATSGLLFQATFKVVGLGVSQLHLFNVVLTNGLLDSTVPVTTTDAYFTNIDCPPGSGAFCTPPIAIFTTSAPPLNPGIPLLFNGSSSHPTTPGASIRFYSWDWGELVYQTVTRNPVTTHVYSNIGNFTVTLRVNDTYGITAISTETINVVSPPPKPDFTINALSAPDGNFLFRGRNMTFPINIRSVNGFHGAVNLSVVDSIPPHRPGSYDLTFSFGANPLILKTGGSNFTELVITAPNNASEIFHYLTVIGTSGTIRQSAFINVFVFQPEIAISCYPPIPGEFPGPRCYSVVLAPGTNMTIPIYVTSLFGFVGNVTQSTRPSLNGDFVFKLAGSTVDLAANKTGVVMLTISAPSQIPVGFYSYAASIMGDSPDTPSGLLSIDVVVDLPPFPPDVAVIAPSSVEVPAGENASFQLSLGSMNGLPGNAVAKVGAVVFPQRTEQISISMPSGYLNMASGTNSTKGEVSVTNATQPGNYVIGVLVEASYEIVTANGFVVSHYLAHSLIITLRVLLPATPPVLAQFHWKHWVSLSKQGLGAGTQTFVVGIMNPNNSTAIYAEVRILGIDNTGQVSFTASSTVLKLLPGESAVNIRLAEVFDLGDVGRAFHFTAVVDWGMNRSVLNLVSDQSVGLNSGLFSVIP